MLYIYQYISAYSGGKFSGSMSAKVLMDNQVPHIPHRVDFGDEGDPKGFPLRIYVVKQKIFF